MLTVLSSLFIAAVAFGDCRYVNDLPLEQVPSEVDMGEFLAQQFMDLVRGQQQQQQPAEVAVEAADAAAAGQLPQQEQQQSTGKDPGSSSAGSSSSSS